MGYDAVVFDMDGVLLTGRHTPRDVYRQAIRDVFADCGVTDPPQAHVEAFVEPDPFSRLAGICAAHGLSLPAVWTAREARASKLERRLLGDETRTLYDDADVLETLADEVALGVVSNNRHQTVVDVIEAFGLADALTVYRGRDPTLDGFIRRKPDSYYLDAVLDDLGTRSALFVGDRVSDLHTAARAGVDGALLRRSHNSDLPADPTHDIASLRDLPALV